MGGLLAEPAPAHDCAHRRSGLAGDRLTEVRGYPGVAAAAKRGPRQPDNASLLIPFVLDVGGGQRLSMFTTLTTFGTPLDVTLAELAVELFYPADVESARMLRGE